VPERWHEGCDVCYQKSELMNPDRIKQVAIVIIHAWGQCMYLSMLGSCWLGSRKGIGPKILLQVFLGGAWPHLYIQKSRLVTETGSVLSMKLSNQINMESACMILPAIKAKDLRF